MRSDFGSRTMDGSSSIMRCMAVGLTPEQAEACRRAIVPVEVVIVRDVKEAASRMSTVLPLVVIVDEAISDADRQGLIEFTTACGAELVSLQRAPEKTFATRILDALRIAERRRVGAR